MDSWDIKKLHKQLYAPKSTAFEIVDVPEIRFVMIDGEGDPNTSPAYATAIQTLYAISYGARAICKQELGRVHTVAPLEGLWTADNLDAFLSGDRDRWRWTAMIAQPDWITTEIFESARHRALEKAGSKPELARLESLREGLAVQFLHIGPYRDEGPHIAEMHGEFTPAHGFTMRDRHHEIYLSDPGKIAPEKLRTIVRQPVDRIG